MSDLPPRYGPQENDRQTKLAKPLTEKLSELVPVSSSDFTVALQNEYDRVMVSLGVACRKSGGDLNASDVVSLMAKADALDTACKLWGVNPNNQAQARRAEH